MAKKRQRKPNDEYELPSKSVLRPDTKRVLAIDPGSKNMGISIVAAKGTQVRIIANTVLTNPIHDLTQFETQKRVFLSEIRLWMDLYQPNGIIAERFQTRGAASMGVTIEAVGTMNGILAGAFENLPLKLTTASTWKNALHRRFASTNFDLKELYNECRTTPHQLDSCFIGVFGLELGLQTQFEFEPHQIALQAEETSLIRLKGERRPRK
jgi:Holliday junction resolvasome RuvABC endonuclease subunit